VTDEILMYNMKIGEMMHKGVMCLSNL